MSNDIGVPATLPSVPRVVIVDADHRVRSGMAGLLELADGLTIAAAVGTADEAIAAGRLDPDAFLIDPRLPEAEDGLALIPRLRVVAPRARVLVMWWTPAVAEAALACGADGVIDKCEDPTPFTEDLLAALAAPRGGSPIVPGREAAAEPVNDPATEPSIPRIAGPEGAPVPRPAHP
ncbi:MAG TPA: response regulator transcription factor [Candidatus Binatia bacterium]|nr:response regulator transcription factor [Candidatus Binatia bacterium]